MIKVSFRCPPQNSTLLSTQVPLLPLTENFTGIIEADYTKQKPRQLIYMATGYRDSYLWLEWLIQNSQEQNVSHCLACAVARPHLFTEPAPLYPEDRWGFKCMLRLTREAVSKGNCTTLASLFPPIDNKTVLGPFIPRKANYTCFNFTVSGLSNHEHDAIEIRADWCVEVYPVRGNASRNNDTYIGSWARSVLYYYYGQYRLFVNPKGNIWPVRAGAVGGPINPSG